MAYFVYILKSLKDGSYYIGHTGDLEERVDRRNQGRSRYTRGKLPWKLIYQKVFDSKRETVRRERKIKKRKDRRYIFNLVRTSPG